MTAKQQHHLKPASLLFSNLFPLLLRLSLPHSTFTKQQFLPANFSIPSQLLPFSSKLNTGRSSQPDADRSNKINRPKTPLPLPLPISPPSSKTFLPSPLARSTSTVLTCDHRLYQVSLNTPWYLFTVSSLVHKDCFCNAPSIPIPPPLNTFCIQSPQRQNTILTIYAREGAIVMYDTIREHLFILVPFQVPLQ